MSLILLEETYINEIESDCYIYEHTKTNSKIAIIKNNDKHKTFSIAFRTLPKNSKGVAHILEHSVFCGSEKYDIKDPFGYFAKTSLKTYLNAYTAPDKTVYPFATYNDKDYINLMRMYLDAVFNPNIYKYKEIFLQEGIRIEEKDGLYNYNGVVFNEMKGAMSSTESFVFRSILKLLYKDSIYSYNSGGDPKEIINLTYEEFLDLHKNFYTPSNACIVMYGDISSEDIKIVEEYLDLYEKREYEYDFLIPDNYRGEFIEECEYYNEHDEYVFTYNFSLDIDNSIDIYGMNILDYILIDSDFAIIKRKLQKENIAVEVYSHFLSEIKKPVFSIIAKGCKETDFNKFIEIVENTINDLKLNGIKEEYILSGINYYLFKLRESDYGSYPKGLVYSESLLDDWIVNENIKFDYLRYEQSFEFFKKNINTYFVDLLDHSFIQNNYKNIIKFIPNKNLLKQEDEFLKESISKIDEKVLEEITIDNLSLNAYIEQDDLEEVVNNLPKLTLDDISKEARKTNLKEEIVNNRLVLHSNKSKNIFYIKYIFGIKHIPKKYLPYLSLYNEVIGFVDMKNRTFEEYMNDVYMYTGSISTNISRFLVNDTLSTYKSYLNVNLHVLEENLDKGIELVLETLFDNLFTKDVILDILKNVNSELMSSIVRNGNQYAISRINAMYRRVSAESEFSNGIEYYRFLQKIIKNYENEYENLINIFLYFTKSIFVKDNLKIYVNISDEKFETNKEKIVSFADKLPEILSYQSYMDILSKVNTVDFGIDFIENTSVNENILEYREEMPLLPKRNEAFIIPTSVYYVGKSIDVNKSLVKELPKLRIFSKILNNEYLFKEVRIKGGAYGVGIDIKKNGIINLVSYRDSNIENTLKVYDKIADSIDSITQELIDDCLIGVVGSMDWPLNDKRYGNFELENYILKNTNEDLQYQKEELFNVKLDDILKCKELFDKSNEYNYVVVGCSNLINENMEKFDSVENIADM